MTTIEGIVQDYLDAYRKNLKSPFFRGLYRILKSNIKMRRRLLDYFRDTDLIESAADLIDYINSQSKNPVDFSSNELIKEGADAEFLVYKKKQSICEIILSKICDDDFISYSLFVNGYNNVKGDVEDLSVRTLTSKQRPLLYAAIIKYIEGSIHKKEEIINEEERIQ